MRGDGAGLPHDHGDADPERGTAVENIKAALKMLVLRKKVI